jgi:hypothetical protein
MPNPTAEQTMRLVSAMPNQPIEGLASPRAVLLPNLQLLIGNHRNLNYLAIFHILESLG